MRFFILLLISLSAMAEQTICKEEKFDDWVLNTSVDDFENDIDASITSRVYNSNGKDIGQFKISFMSQMKHANFVFIQIDGLDGSWPACDLEYVKYKVDTHESKYIPRIGHTCKRLNFKPETFKDFSSGEELKISAAGRTGIISLEGFTDAHKSAIRSLDYKKCKVE